MLTKTNYYPSFFTAEESKEIISELMETIPFTMLPACFGVKSNDPKVTSEPLPWTDLLLSIKQFVEDRLELDINSAWLSVNLDKKKGSFLKGLEEMSGLLAQPLAFAYFGHGLMQNGSLLIIEENINWETLQQLSKPKRGTGLEFTLVFPISL